MDELFFTTLRLNRCPVTIRNLRYLSLEGCKFCYLGRVMYCSDDICHSWTVMGFQRKLMSCKPVYY